MKSLPKIENFSHTQLWESAVYQQVINDVRNIVRQRVFNPFEAESIALEAVTEIINLSKTGGYDRVFSEVNFLKLVLFKVSNQLIVNHIRRIKAKKNSTTHGAISETSLTSSQSGSSRAFETMAVELGMYTQNIENVNVRRLFRNAINRMTDNMTIKRVLFGYFIFGLKQTEIENIFGIKTNTVKSILRRNKDNLRQLAKLF